MYVTTIKIKYNLKLSFWAAAGDFGAMSHVILLV